MVMKSLHHNVDLTGLVKMAARDFVVAAKVTASSGTLALKTLVLLEREREIERERVRVCVCVCV